MLFDFLHCTLPCYLCLLLKFVRMKTFHLSLVTLLSFFVLTCQEAPRSGGSNAVVETASIDETEYEVESIDGSTTQRVLKRDAFGGVVESGFVRDGLKQGTWSTFGDQVYPEKIISYIDGALNGPYIEMDEQGRIALLANYKANVLHGPYSKYRIGRPTQTTAYVDGLIDGPMAEFDFRNGKIKQEVNYKMGELHGPFRYFNAEGEVTLEYTYINGERVEK